MSENTLAACESGVFDRRLVPKLLELPPFVLRRCIRFSCFMRSFCRRFCSRRRLDVRFFPGGTYSLIVIGFSLIAPVLMVLVDTWKDGFLSWVCMVSPPRLLPLRASVSCDGDNGGGEAPCSVWVEM